MSVLPVQTWVVRCDADPAHMLSDSDGSATLFYSYETAVSLAKLGGWIFTPDHWDRVVCPQCALEGKL